MEKLIEAKRNLQELFEQFLTVPTYSMQCCLENALQQYRKMYDDYLENER